MDHRTLKIQESDGFYSALYQLCTWVTGYVKGASPPSSDTRLWHNLLHWQVSAQKIWKVKSKACLRPLKEIGSQHIILKKKKKKTQEKKYLASNEYLSKKSCELLGFSFLNRDLTLGKDNSLHMKDVFFSIITCCIPPD